jgi:hypothetical protein
MFPLTASANWWDTWDAFDLRLVEWPVVARQWPTVGSLAFFFLILVPIRIPSLALVTGSQLFEIF